MFVEMDEELRRAAVNGDVEFLRKCQSSDKPKPNQYYSSFFPNLGDGSHFGNIFHMAADNNRQDFIREAIRILPSDYTTQLLSQPREPYNANPLHIAANTGNVEIVKMLLDVYTSLSLPSDDLSQDFRPWFPLDFDKFEFYKYLRVLWINNGGQQNYLLHRRISYIFTYYFLRNYFKSDMLNSTSIKECQLIIIIILRNNNISGGCFNFYCTIFDIR